MILTKEQSEVISKSIIQLETIGLRSLRVRLSDQNIMVCRDLDGHVSVVNECSTKYEAFDNLEEFMLKYELMIQGD